MSNFSDITLELSLLLACLENNNDIDTAAAIISRADFSHNTHKEIFDYLINKRRLNESVDLTQLKSVFSNVSEHFWSSLEAQNSFINVRDYAKSIRSLSIKNKLFALLSASSQELKSSLSDGVEFSHELNQKIYSLISDLNDDSMKNATQAVKEFYEELSRISANIDANGTIGLDTGYSLLNKHTKGFKAGELIIIAARPGMGKTTLALNMVLKTLRNRIGVVFYSLETEAKNLVAKLIASDTSIPLQELMNADDINQETIQDSANMLANNHLYIYDKGNLTIEFLRSSLRRLKEEHEEIGLCVIDYIQLMTSLNQRADRHVQVSEISRGLKLIALELKMPIIALSQVNRAVESRKGKGQHFLMLSDLRESGSIEQDADLVLFINSKGDEEGESDYVCERHVVLSGAKNRSGSLFNIDFDFKASKAKFMQIIRQQGENNADFLANNSYPPQGANSQNYPPQNYPPQPSETSEF